MEKRFSKGRLILLIAQIRQCTHRLARCGLSTVAESWLEDAGHRFVGRMVLREPLRQLESAGGSFTSLRPGRLIINASESRQPQLALRIMRQEIAPEHYYRRIDESSAKPQSPVGPERQSDRLPMCRPAVGRACDPGLKSSGESPECPVRRSLRRQPRSPSGAANAHVRAGFFDTSPAA